MNEMAIENLSQSVLETAKNSSFNYSLNGWPASVARSVAWISTSVVLIYAIKTFAAHV